MKKLFVLVMVPLFAGCFAWDMDDKPLPWMDDPVDRPSIGKVVYYPDDPEPRPIPRDKDFRAYYEEGLHPEWWTPNRAPVQPAPLMREIPPAPAGNPARPPALAEGDLEGEIPNDVIEQAPAPRQPQAAPAEGKLEKRIEALESRIEQLFQELLKAYGDKK